MKSMMPYGMTGLERVKRCNRAVFRLKVSLTLELTAKFKVLMCNNATCDAVENYHVDGGSVSYTVISHILTISAQISGCSGNLKV